MKTNEEFSKILFMDKKKIKTTEKEAGYRYWVVKIEDFVEALTEDELYYFFSMLDKYNYYREPKPINSYWLINRDEYNLPTLEDFLKALEPYKIKKDGANNS